MEYKGQTITDIRLVGQLCFDMCGKNIKWQDPSSATKLTSWHVPAKKSSDYK